MRAGRITTSILPLPRRKRPGLGCPTISPAISWFGWYPTLSSNPSAFYGGLYTGSSASSSATPPSSFHFSLQSYYLPPSTKISLTPMASEDKPSIEPRRSLSGSVWRKKMPKSSSSASSLHLPPTVPRYSQRGKHERVHGVPPSSQRRPHSGR